MVSATTVTENARTDVKDIWEKAQDPAEVVPPSLPNKPLAFVLHFVRAYWWALVPMFFLEIIQASCQILIPKAIQGLMDAVSANSPLGDGNHADKFLQPVWYFIGLSLGILVASRSSGALLVIAGPRLRRQVRFTLYHYLQYHSHRFFSNSFAGSLANRLNEVSMSVNHSLWTVMFDFLPMTVTFSLSLYLYASTNLTLGLTLAGWIGFYVVCSYFLARKCQGYAESFAACRSQVTGRIVDAVTNIQTTKLFAHRAFERQYLFESLTSELKAARKTFWFMEKMRWFQFIATLALQVMMILWAKELWQQGAMTTGEFVMLASLSILMINEARSLTRRFLEFFEYIGNIEDGVKTIIKPHECLDKEGAKPLQVTDGSIEFDKVCFGYSNEAVFKDLSLKIPAGQKVGLVGYSGAGKTTFVNLILRLYDLAGGAIKIDGQDIADCTQDSLRKQISMIPQDPLLFHRSLAENIRYGRLDASEQELLDASKKSFCHEFISAQKDGYESLVGERGIKLSGGQRQRIAIARSLLKNAPILLMDEATSSLDSVTEKTIQDSFKDLMKGKTVIVVAHRLSTISHLDRILVFNQGAIIEDGTHDELLQQNGHYAKLWSMQTHGFLPE